MVTMTDQNNGALFARELQRLEVHFGHQRAGGVNHFQRAGLGFIAHRRRNAVGAENQHRAVRYFLDGFHENRAAPAYRFEMLDFFLGNGEIVGRENSQVSQLAWGESSLFSVFRRKPTAPHGVELECFFTVQSVLLRIEAETPDGLAGDKPVEGKVWVIARNAGCVGACSHGNAHLQHAADPWSSLRLLWAGPRSAIFSLESHTLLH